eukprot:10429795-Karenia_brevis.AAC.1
MLRAMCQDLSTHNAVKRLAAPVVEPAVVPSATHKRKKATTTTNDDDALIESLKSEPLLPGGRWCAKSRIAVHGAE